MNINSSNKAWTNYDEESNYTNYKSLKSCNTRSLENVFVSPFYVESFSLCSDLKKIEKGEKGEWR